MIERVAHGCSYFERAGLDARLAYEEGVETRPAA